jgi:CHASE3 domain sensor protein
LISLAKALVTADATRRRAIGQILLLAAGFLVLVAISVTSVILVNQARDDNRWVVHTVEVENQINTVLLEIRRAESAARGYLLTSEPRFLSEHQDAVARIAPDVDRLVALIGDNPVQIEAVKELRPAV